MFIAEYKLTDILTYLCLYKSKLFSLQVILVKTCTAFSITKHKFSHITFTNLEALNTISILLTSFLKLT